ncbi:MAG: pentapeptide repeat-containing protein [Cyanobium sp.]
MTIALGGWVLGTLSSNRQNDIAQENQKDAVVREYIKEMKGMLLDKAVAKEAKQPGSEANGVARALTLAALTQLKGEGTARRTLVFQFLRESNFQILAGSEKVQGANLAGYDLSGSDLRGASLGEANLSKAHLSEANLSKANLRGADLSSADLRGADLSLADLRGADLRFADLKGAQLGRADLRGAELFRVHLSEACLNDVDLRGADLSFADLRRAHLGGAKFSDADLYEADLSDAVTFYPYNYNDGVSSVQANFSGAKFNDTICPNRKKTDTGCPIP